MKTHVQFRSTRFPPYDGEQEDVNPGLWGKCLAEYLEQELNARGIETNTIYSEDWGWALPIKNDSFPLWIGCGHQDGDDDEFLCFIEPSRPVIRKLFRKIDTTERVGRIAEALEDVLMSDPDIGDVRWLDDEQI